MARSGSAEEIEALAAEIGDAIYLDIAKWHLYLGTAKLHTPLAERLYPLVEAKTISAAAVSQALQDLTVAIGGGQRTLPLLEFLPAAGLSELVRLLENYEANR